MTQARKLLDRSSKLFIVVLAIGLVFSWTVSASANHLPADKPFAAASKTVRFSPNADIPLLSATVKNSKPADMVLAVTLECSIITDNVIAGSTVPGASESATTTGTVRTWITVDGKIVPIISSSAPPQDGSTPPAGDDTDKVTFCNRVFERTVKDTEDPQDGYDGSRDYIATKTANAFNWVRLNMGSGVHTIVLHGELTHSFSPGSTASAYVGNRSLIGLPGKYANDATISDGGTG
jgi:hypothetical protein